MLYFETGSIDKALSVSNLKEGLTNALDKLGKRKKVLIVPPDFTRFHSQAGILTEMIWKYYGDAVTDILPALGTHNAMTEKELNRNVRSNSLVAF